LIEFWSGVNVTFSLAVWILKLKCSFYDILNMYRAHVDLRRVMSTGHLNSSLMIRGTCYGSLMQYMICHNQVFTFINFFDTLQCEASIIVSWNWQSYVSVHRYSKWIFGKFFETYRKKADKDNIFALEYSVSEISHWIYTNFGPSFEVLNSVLAANCFFRAFRPTLRHSHLPT
jgi:hypothetical protein